jgi:hypothetical protein
MLNIVVGISTANRAFVRRAMLSRLSLRTRRLNQVVASGSKPTFRSNRLRSFNEGLTLYSWQDDVQAVRHTSLNMAKDVVRPYWSALYADRRGCLRGNLLARKRLTDGRIAQQRVPDL